MKSTFIRVLIAIIIISISVFGISCKNEESVSVAEDETTATAVEEQVQEATGEEPEDVVDEETADEVIEEETTEEEPEVVEYSIESITGDLLDNPQTRAILEEFIPGIVNSDRVDEARPHPLSLVLGFSDVDEDIILLLDEALRNLEPAGALEEVSYNIRFDAIWSDSTHPDNYVSNAHFSPFVIYSYNGTDQGRIFTNGSISTPGMEEMAETGATSMLEEEINQIIAANNALSYVKAKSIDSPGQIEETLNFTQEFGQFIFVTMIAPSPDWFIAGEADLFADGQWVDQIVIDLISFDAGTDSGDTLTSADSDTDPKQPISEFDDSLQGLGTITITRS